VSTGDGEEGSFSRAKAAGGVRHFWKQLLLFMLFDLDPFLLFIRGHYGSHDYSSTKRNPVDPNSACFLETEMFFRLVGPDEGGARNL
jgi:hypothetical protein